MFHSYFNEYAFVILLTSSCTFHRRKFLFSVTPSFLVIICWIG
nr:MAG TPA: hypothetical protein [Caudoviricetes sp.]